MNDNDFGFVSFYEPEKQIPKSDNDFGFVSLYEQPNEKSTQNDQSTPSFGKELLRHGARSVARGAETLLGLPGDVLSLAKTGVGKGVELIAGKPLPQFREALEKGPSAIQGDEFTPEAIPTSENLKEITGAATKGLTNPQSEIEEGFDELVSDFASLALPVKGKIPFTRALGTSLFANLGKQLVKDFGGSETAQNATKIGSMFLAGMFRPKQADKFVDSLYKESKELIPKGTMIPSESIVKNLSHIENDLSKGLETATKDKVLRDVKTLKNKASGGAIPLDEVVQTYHDINENMRAKKLFDELSKGERKLLKDRYNNFKKEVSNTIEDYGKYNPEFVNKWRSANEAYSAIAESKKVSGMVMKAAKSKHTLAASPALLVFEAMNPAMAAKTAGAIAIGYGIAKPAELAFRFAKSPTLRKYYLGVIDNSIKENLPGVITNLSKLDKEMKKENFIPLQK